MDKLTIYQRPLLSNPSLLVGFTGWMDGGDVSAVRWPISKKNLQQK